MAFFKSEIPLNNHEIPINFLFSVALSTGPFDRLREHMELSEAGNELMND